MNPGTDMRASSTSYNPNFETGSIKGPGHRGFGVLAKDLKKLAKETSNATD